MEILVEILFQFVFEVVLEFFVEFGFRGAARAARSKWGRAIAGALVGFGFGLWWGARLSDDSLGHRPRLLWLSLAAAVVALVIAATRQPDERRWPRYRFLSLAAMNLAIALGIELGFDPSSAEDLDRLAVVQLVVAANGLPVEPG